ncbi:hypothetical protein HPB47_001780, partial [Ixodes persulcatus]
SKPHPGDVAVEGRIRGLSPDHVSGPSPEPTSRSPPPRTSVVARFPRKSPFPISRRPSFSVVPAVTAHQTGRSLPSPIAGGLSLELPVSLSRSTCRASGADAVREGGPRMSTADTANVFKMGPEEGAVFSSVRSFLGALRSLNCISKFTAANMKDLDALYIAECVLGDGNLKYNPKEFHNPGQLYILHAVVNGEAQPVVYALMQASDVRAYETLLTCVGDAMDTRLREAGAEAVYCLAQGAPKDPNISRAQLNHQGPLFPGYGNPLVHEWLRRVRHLPFVPNDFRLDFAADFIAARPSMAPLDSARLQQFAVYMSGFWLSNPTARDVWGQFGAGGPRTTNMVEGRLNWLHNWLSTYRPAEFIQFLQVAQFASQNRIVGLD